MGPPASKYALIPIGTQTEAVAGGEGTVVSGNISSNQAIQSDEVCVANSTLSIKKASLTSIIANFH